MLPNHWRPDGCTLFIDGTHTSCCDLHDADYYLGINRKVADLNLKKCVRRVRKKQWIEEARSIKLIPCKFCRGVQWTKLWLKYKAWMVLCCLMYLGVRTFGWHFWHKRRCVRDGVTSKETHFWFLQEIKLWIKKKF
jgi:hypothetical protein